MTEPHFIRSGANELSRLVVEEAVRRNTHLASATAALARDWISSGGPTTPHLRSPMPGLEMPAQKLPIAHAGLAKQPSKHHGDT